MRFGQVGEIPNISGAASEAAAALWTEQSQRKSMEKKLTPEEAISMRAKVDEIAKKIESLFDESKAIIATIEKGRNAPGRAELKDQLAGELTAKKMDLGRQIRALEDQKTDIEQQLDAYDKMQAMKEDYFVPTKSEGKPSDAPFTLQ